ncbi:hypothetical protein Dimus_018541 [Dionaea muscipula]
MRLKKQKRHRRVVRFYTACFGFREPFKVICDGTFVHHLVSNQLVPHEKAVSNALGGSVKLFTTRCVIAEMKSLGESHAGSFNAARNDFKIASCEHEKRKNAVACIMEIIREDNPDHFFVGTQDIDLRRKLKEIPGVPVIYGLRNALFLEQPSTFQREFVMSSEQKRLHMTELEHEMLKKRARDGFNAMKAEEQLRPEDAENGIDEDAESQILATQSNVKKVAGRKRLHMTDRPQFKRNRAKGPNPLSCLKKKKRPDPNAEKVNVDSSENRSRGRKRKRSRRTKLPGTND